jgi:peptidoglycan-associated lipoprotein
MKTSFICMAAVFALAACASDPVVQAPVQTQAPTPRPTPQPRTAPRTPVQAQNTQPVYTPTPGSIEEFSTSAGDRVYFSYDSYTLNGTSRNVLSKQATWLSSYPRVRVLVAGNCDERGTREYNLALGARRAAAVKDYLVSLGVDPSRVTTISYGKERPIDPRSMGEAWSINRNAHTAIVSGAAS